MDIYCPKCGEPVEVDYLHDIADDQSIPFGAVFANFARMGCRALDAVCNPRADTARASAMGAMFDLCGDDIDGIASLMDDLD